MYIEQVLFFHFLFPVLDVADERKNAPLFTPYTTYSNKGLTTRWLSPGG